LFIAIPLILCFASCEPLTGDAGEGNVTITLPGGSGDRAVEPAILERLVYTMTFSGPGGEKRTRTTGPGSGSVRINLDPGDWTVSAEAFLDAALFGTGSAAFTVRRGENTTVTIAMSRIAFTVNFHANGGSPAPAPQAVPEGGKAAVPVPMLKPAVILSFEGLYQDTAAEWYTDAACTVPYNFDAPVTANLDLYAGWGSMAAVDLSSITGSNIAEKAFAYISGLSPSVKTNYIIVINGGNYHIFGTFNIITPNAVVTLVGLGPVVIDSGNGNLFYIRAGELVLDNNITLNGDSANNDPLVYVDSSASLTMKAGAAIKDNINLSTPGGGVYVFGGSFTMEGGEISGNTANVAPGGGVYINNGSFIMSGGKISGNAASSIGYGGGVYVFGSFDMSGGEISGNTASTGGGGVYVDGSSFTMSGGAEISGNTANSIGGGGVYVSGSVGFPGSFTMNGGKISGNTAPSGGNGQGGGVYVYTGGSFDMSDGEISGNTANSSGGGVYIEDGSLGSNAFFSKTGGTIYGDTDNDPDNGDPTDNTAKTSYNTIYGHAVYYYNNSGTLDVYYRDTPLNTGDAISTSQVPATATGAYDATNWIKKP
jgi:hypothetical protein